MAAHIVGLVWLGMLAACAGVAQTSGPHSDLLARIRKQLATAITKLPDYSCVENFYRLVKRPSGMRWFEDRVRLEVAMIGDKELFAWPGSREFATSDPAELAGNGLIGTGSFAIHAKTIATTRAPVFTWAGEEVMSGRRAVRYNFRVPPENTNYWLHIRGQHEKLPYSGSLWADAATLDLLRIEVHAEDIPPSLDCVRTEENVYYRRVDLGASSALLAETAEFAMTDRAGREMRNRLRFTDCRQYTTESSIRFDAPPEETGGAQAAAREIRLPAGLLLDIRLEQDIDADEAAAGDPVAAQLANTIKVSKELRIPKGATVAGRILRLERHTWPQSFVLLGLELTEVRFEGGRAPLKARLIGPMRGQSALSRTVPTAFYLDILPNGEEARDGESLIRFRGLKLPKARAFRMFWETL